MYGGLGKVSPSLKYAESVRGVPEHRSLRGGIHGVPVCKTTMKIRSKGKYVSSLKLLFFFKVDIQLRLVGEYLLIVVADKGYAKDRSSL